MTLPLFPSSKTDLGGNESAGAKIQILDSNGKVASDKDSNKLEWTSEADKTKVITESCSRHLYNA